MEALNYFPNILHPLDKLKPLELQVYEIRLKLRGQNTETLKVRRRSWPKLHVPYDEENNIEMRPFSRSFRKEAMDRDLKEPEVPANPGAVISEDLVPSSKYSPLKILDITSFILTLIILFFCIWNRDAIACMALAVLSIISSIVGYASKWTPALTRRPSTAQTPRGDVMIRTREGGFILVLCEEEVARELYFGNEQCEYKVRSTVFYRALVGTATFLLMSSVILLGNCKFIQQAAIGGAYIVLNFAYWMVSMVPKKRLWDISRYECDNLAEDEELKEFIAIQNSLNEKPSFTRTLWYAIYASESTEWCKISDATPKTDAWMKWLEQAKENSEDDNKQWNPVKALNTLLKDSAQVGPKIQHRNTMRNSQEDERELERIEKELKERLKDIEGIRRRMGGRVQGNGAQTWS